MLNVLSLCHYQRLIVARRLRSARTQLSLAFVEDNIVAKFFLSLPEAITINFSLKKCFTFVLPLFSVIHISGHFFNLTNLTESMSKADTEIEQHLSQLDNPWLNPIRESGVVSIKPTIISFDKKK